MNSTFNKHLKVHFIGIGGISMSALAKYLIINGFFVSGSDSQKNALTTELEGLGCKIFYNHSETNIVGVDVVVYSSAIAQDNPELLAAQKNKFAIYKRSELLRIIADSFYGKIGVSGSHGKTTTTAILSHILKSAGAEFTAHIGGIDCELGNIFCSGKKIFLSEVCEYKRNIDLFNADIALCLNIDNDHLDSYNNFAELCGSFYSFLSRAEVAVINRDDPLLQKCNKNCVTFGIKNYSDYMAENIKRSKKGLTFSVSEYGKKLFNVKTESVCSYNIYNILAAIAAARVLKVEKRKILSGINNFKAIKRRNEYLGKIKSSDVYADYAHHPSEIACSLSNFHSIIKGNLYIVFQPHTYSRTKLLFDDFVKAFACEKNLILFKTYAARESYDPKGSAKELCKALPQACYFENENELFNYLNPLLTPKDGVLILGAGNLYDKISNFISKKNK